MSATSTPTRWEALLRSARGRAALCALAVLVLSALLTVQLSAMLQDREREVDSLRLFGSQLLHWGLWALLAAPIAWFARWSWTRLRPWPLALALQCVLAPTVGFGQQLMLTAAVERLALRPGPTQTSAALAERDARFAAGERPGRSGAGRPRALERGAPGRRAPFWNRSPWGPARGALTYFALLGMSLGLNTWLRTRDEERRAAALELAATRLQGELDRARLDRLSAQLRPHFLFNTLHAVGGLVREGRNDDALTTLAAVGDLLRASLDTSSRQELTLAEELEAVTGFLAIASLRLGERLVLEREIDPACHAALVPALVLLPLLENAVIHAAEPRVQPTRVTLCVQRVDQTLRLSVADDGPGLPDDVRECGGAVEHDRVHIGLANTRSRLAGLYGDAGRLELGASPSGGALVTVSLPWHTEPLARSPDALGTLDP